MNEVNRVISGVKPDPYDPRDFKFSIGVIKKLSAPSSLDLRDKFGAIEDQGAINSCTGNGLASAFELEYRAKYKRNLDVSRLFIYYNERMLENEIELDEGAYIRDGIKTLAKNGVCTEAMWPYDKQHLFLKPPQTAYDDALRKRILRYERVPNDVLTVKAALAQNHAVVVGIRVYESFMSNAVAVSGIVPMPVPKEREEGGHCVVLAGYGPDYFWVRNSWGTGWGIGGYFKIPTAYIAEPYLCSDMWTLTSIS